MLTYNMAYNIEMTMGTGFPVGMGILRNGNKPSVSEWEREAVGMNVDGNGVNPYSHGFFTVVNLHQAVDQSCIYWYLLRRMIV